MEQVSWYVFYFLFSIYLLTVFYFNAMSFVTREEGNPSFLLVRAHFVTKEE